MDNSPDEENLSGGIGTSHAITASALPMCDSIADYTPLHGPICNQHVRHVVLQFGAGLYNLADSERVAITTFVYEAAPHVPRD